MIIMTVLNLTQFLPNPTIPRGTASDGRIEDAASEEPNINAVPPPTTGKFTETNQIKSMLKSIESRKYNGIISPPGQLLLHVEKIGRSCEG